MMAIFSSQRSWTLEQMFTSGMKRVSAFRSCSAMNFFTASMAMGWSMVPRVQASSQRRLHTRPHTAGNGFSRLMSSSASVYLPSAAFFR